MPRRKAVRVEPDADVDVAADIDFGAVARLLGQRGGQSKSRAKRAAARANGAKGGRPPKQKS
jgi:hypothetical protein